jgi:hypothetical protein
MGLDVYVGSLTRYYLGEWETIVQRMAREQGMEFQVVRKPPNRSIIHRILERVRWFRSGPEEMRKTMLQWQRTLARESGIGSLFEWNDELEYEYFTDKPAWDCYGALLLWACYDQVPTATPPATARDWTTDVAYQAVRGLRELPYPHLLQDTEFWFPVDFPFPFRARTILQEDVEIGSSIRLLEELRSLNTRTWHATPAELSNWRREGAQYGAPLEKSAQFAFALLYELCELAVQHRLPMKLDY